MKMQYSFLFFLLMLFSGCQKTKQEDSKIISPKGTWSILSVVDKTGITPNDVSSLIGGVAVFTETDYKFTNKSNETMEVGLWRNENAASNTFLVKPIKNSIFGEYLNNYQFSTLELTSSTIQLKINIAKPNEPEDNLFIQLTK